MINLQVSNKEQDEINAAAEFFDVSVDEFVSQSVLWVVYNCAEVASETPRIDKMAKVWYNPGHI